MEQCNGIAIRGLAFFSCIPVKDKSNLKVQIVQLGVEPI